VRLKGLPRLWVILLLFTSTMALGSLPVAASSLGPDQEFFPSTVAPGHGSVPGIVSSGSSTPGPLTAGVTLLCSIGELAAGIYPGIGGEFVQAYYSGTIYWCSSGVATPVASPPTGDSGNGHWGFAGVKTGLGLVLVSMDFYGQMWLCFGATSSGCSIESTLINLPPAFCSAQPQAVCNPNGIVVDKKLNIWYADVVNSDVVKCTFASGYQSCTAVDTGLGTPGVLNGPVGIYRDASGNIWTTQQACGSKIWENMAVNTTLSDWAVAITMSSANPAKTPHLYVGITGECGSVPGYVYDVTDGRSLPTPLAVSDYIIGLTTKLQFTVASSLSAYAVKDKLV
jgi:hypothetical protein